MISPGTHIQVRRQLRWVGLPYHHHGICVDGSEVIEFGGGGLLNKAQTQIRKVSLTCFAQPQPLEAVEAVTHPITWSGQTYSPLLPPEQVVDRAKWLLHDQAPPYRLGYRNCESIAIWCATGDFESFQAKKFMFWRLPITLATFVLWTKKPSIGKPLLMIGLVITMLTAVPYLHSRKLFDHTRRYPGVGKWTSTEVENL